jgi:glyoxylase-like metal-dependent hydrolase (beta-lactamase superfamily II)
VFSQARFVMGEDEWNFWNGDLTELHGAEQMKRVLRQAAQKNLPPIRDQLDLIDRGKEIVPGIEAVPAPGHTPGHMAVSVTSGEEHLLCLGDAMLHPVHVEEPDWYAMIDFSPEKTVASRYQLLKFAVDQNGRVFGFHFPFPGLGRIAGTHGRWTWQPWS